MTIDEYTKKNNLPKMKFMGEMKNLKYYIEKNIPPKMQIGFPMVIAENKKSGFFEICNTGQAIKLMAYFREENKK